MLLACITSVSDEINHKSNFAPTKLLKPLKVHVCRTVSVAGGANVSSLPSKQRTVHIALVSVFSFTGGCVPYRTGEVNCYGNKIIFHTDSYAVRVIKVGIQHFKAGF